MTPYYSDDWATLYCADCLDLLPELGRFDLVLTDPPFGIGLRSHDETGNRHKGGASRRGRDHYVIAGDESQDAGQQVLDWAEAQGMPVAVFASPWRPWRGDWRSLLVWDKGPAVGGGGDTTVCFKRTWELLQIARNGPLRAGRGESVLHFPVVPNDSKDHIAQKPLPLLEYVVEQLTTPGDMILDPFSGSGSTGVACKNLGRKCVMIEIDERHCETAARRLVQGVLDFGAGAEQDLLREIAAAQ